MPAKPDSPHGTARRLAGVGLVLAAVSLGLVAARPAGEAPGATSPPPPTAVPTPPFGPGDALAYFRTGRPEEAWDEAAALLATGTLPAAEIERLLARPEPAGRVLVAAAADTISADQFRRLLKAVKGPHQPTLDYIYSPLGEGNLKWHAGTTQKALALLARWPRDPVLLGETSGWLLRGTDARTAQQQLALVQGRALRKVPKEWGVAFAAMGSSADRPTLRALLKDPRPDRRVFAVTGLHGLGDARDLPAFVEALRDRDGRVALLAMRAALDHSPARPGAHLRALVAKSRGPASALGRAWLKRTQEPPLALQPLDLADPPAEDQVPIPDFSPAPIGPLSADELRRLAALTHHGDNRHGNFKALVSLLTPANASLFAQAADGAGETRADLLQLQALVAPPQDLPRLRADLAAEAPYSYAWVGLGPTRHPGEVSRLLAHRPPASLQDYDVVGRLGGPEAVAALSAALPRDPRALTALLVAGGHPADIRPIARMLAMPAAWATFDCSTRNVAIDAIAPDEPLRAWFSPFLINDWWLEAGVLDAVRAARQMPDPRLGPALYPLLDRAAGLADVVHDTLVATPFDHDEAGIERALQGANETLAVRLALVQAARHQRHGDTAKAKGLLDQVATRPVVRARPDLGARVELARAALLPPAAAAAYLAELGPRFDQRFSPIDALRFPDRGARVTLARARAALAAAQPAQALALARSQIASQSDLDALLVAYQASRLQDGTGPVSGLSRTLEQHGIRALRNVLGSELGHATIPSEFLAPPIEVPPVDETWHSMSDEREMAEIQAESDAKRAESDREHALDNYLNQRAVNRCRQWFAETIWASMKASGQKPPYLLGS